MKQIPKKSIAFHDQPLKNFGQKDWLGTFQFARKLANRIIQWPHEQSVVIALYGGWGDGKSTIKNLVVKEIENQERESFLVVPFNPWIFSGQDQLHDAFFNELRRSIEKDKAVGAKELANEFRDWSVAIRSTVSFIPVLVALGLGKDKGEIAKSLLETINPIFERECEVFKENKPLAKRKDSLIGKLKSYGKNILIVIDDIDRLSAEEIGQIFQLVKAHGDLPFVRYLLLFEKGVVESSLDKLTKEGLGSEYLEKIVQVGIHLPKIQPSSLKHYLNEMIKATTGINSSTDSRWNSLTFPPINGQ